MKSHLFGVGESDDTQTTPQQVGFGSDRASRIPVLVAVQGEDIEYSCIFSHRFEDRNNRSVGSEVRPDSYQGTMKTCG